MSGKVLNVKVVTPWGAAFEGEASEVIAPSVEGYFGVLPNHIAFRCLLREGKLRIKKVDGTELAFRTGAGFFEVESNRVIVAVESAEKLKGEGG